MFKSKRNRMGKNDTIFYICLILFPVLQFCIFYIGVNFNSIMLSFKSYNYGLDGGTVGFYWVGFENFAQCFSDLIGENALFQLQAGIKNSFIVFLSNIFISVPLSLLFSYYIFKKNIGHKVFKVLLFIPSIVSSVVMCIIFQYFSEKAIPEIWQTIFGESLDGLLTSESTRFATLVFYNIWIGFGSVVLLYSGAMSSVNESVIEAGKLDGISPIKELIYIVFPKIYSTFVVFFINNIALLFMNQLNLFSFFGDKAEFADYTLGYYIYVKTQAATNGELPYLAAMGILMTIVAIPLTFVVNFALNKLGPKED